MLIIEDFVYVWDIGRKPVKDNVGYIDLSVIIYIKTFRKVYFTRYKNNCQTRGFIIFEDVGRR